MSKCETCIHNRICELKPPEQYPKEISQLIQDNCEDYAACDITSDEVEQAFRQGYIEGHKQGKEEALEPKGIKLLAEHYGFTSQANMLVEESAEFTQALNKLRRSHTDAYANVKEELADVLLIALQLRYLLGAKDIDTIMYLKCIRQLRRILEEITNE